MANHGDQATPLWLTEIGWTSTPPDGYCPPPGGGDDINVGPEAQAQLLTDLFNSILANREDWNVQRVYWFDGATRIRTLRTSTSAVAAPPPAC